MPTLDSIITDFVVGDDLDVRRTIPNVPDGDSIAKAWFTLKEKEDDDDDDAIFQINGTIEDDGTTTHIAIINFPLSHTDTVEMTGNKKYYFDVQVLTANNAIYTPEKGRMTGRKQITKAVS